ncbi:MAG: glycerol-3-phosphate acyltransferase [Oscillospiraceae bacterium]|nr:glycerol-3-phosphate acyltransferase [Oscillospiraceae bacterium]
MGFAAAFLAALLFPAVPGAAAVAGVAAVLGHIFPFYLRFQGGKGFASFLGLTLALDWKFFLAIILIVACITFISDYIVPGTLTTIISFPLYLFLRHFGILIIVVVCIASIVILLKHLVNIKRLITGEEIGLRRAMSKEDKISQ